MDHQSLADLFLKQAAQFGRQIALKAKRNGRYENVSWEEFRRRVVQFCLLLNRLGIRKGDRIGILSENRPEWAYADLGALCLGAVVVPLYPTASPKEIEYVLAHCEAKLLFISTRDQLERIRSIFPSVKTLQSIVVFEETEPSESIFSLSRFIADLDPEAPSCKNLFAQLSSSVRPDDLATIIYTSGTTGPPKGVMLSHRNFLVNCEDSMKAIPIHREDISLSFLPLSHVFERMAGHYLSLMCGVVTAYAEHMNAVPQNLLEVRPTVSRGVPRFFEKVYAQIHAQVERKGVLIRRLFHWAVGVGKKVSACRMVQKPLPIFLSFQYQLAHLLVFKKIYRGLGGRIRFFISGGAPLAKELAEFFYSLGILVLEGYGLTETSPVISVNRVNRFKFGSVGIPLDQVEVKIDPEGEILVRGPSVMMSYYKDESATRAVMEGEWLHTGDLGRIDSDGFLYITGRIKDIIVTSGGKNISPQNIENLLLSDPLISQVVVIGDKRNFLTALIVPNLERLRSELMTAGISAGEEPAGKLIERPESHRLIRMRLEEKTKDCAQYEKIKYFTLLGHEFTHENKELTLTLKVKRHVIHERYAETIERMYRETQNIRDGGTERFFYLL